MPRRPTGYWGKSERCWLARLGDVSPVTGKRKAVALRHEDGRPIERRDNAAATRAVLRLLEGIDREREAEAERARTGPTVAEVCRAYVAWQYDRGAARRTITDLHRHLDRFGRFRGKGDVSYGSRPAASIVPADLWAMQDAGLGGVRNLFASIGGCWAWAARPIRGREPARLLPSNPLQGIEKPAAGSRADVAIPWKDTRAILRKARGWARHPAPTDRRAATTRASRRLRVLCLHFLAAVGARPYEAWGLRWDEVLWDEGVVAISRDRDKGRRPGRAARKPRRFAVPPRIMRALAIVREWPRANPEWAFVLDRRATRPSEGEWSRWLGEDLKPALRARGAPIPEAMTSYWLRHSAITDAVQGGGSTDLIGDQFGNSGAVIRSVYAHARDEARRDIAENLARSRRRKKGTGEPESPA